MKKTLFIKIIAITLSMAFLFPMTSCGKQSTEIGANESSYNNGQSGNSNEDLPSSSKWGLTINGKSVALPCTLADLKDIDVHLLIDPEKENILNSTNQEFTMIAAVCGESSDPMYLTIKTGNDSAAKEKNATVEIITNMTINNSIFKIKNGLGLGSDISDVIEAYGKDYSTSADESELNTGYVTLRYGTMDDGSMFNFQNGKLTYIEFFVNQGE